MVVFVLKNEDGREGGCAVSVAHVAKQAKRGGGLGAASKHVWQNAPQPTPHPRTHTPHRPVFRPLSMLQVAAACSDVCGMMHETLGAEAIASLASTPLLNALALDATPEVGGAEGGGRVAEAHHFHVFITCSSPCPPMPVAWGCQILMPLPASVHPRVTHARTHHACTGPCPALPGCTLPWQAERFWLAVRAYAASSPCASAEGSVPAAALGALAKRALAQALYKQGRCGAPPPPPWVRVRCVVCDLRATTHNQIPTSN